MKSAFEEKKESSVGMTLQLFVQNLSTQIKVDFRNVSDEKRKHLKSQIKVVVSIGHFLVFYVVFFPLEYIPSKPPLSTYILVFPLKEGPKTYFY